MDPDWPFTSQAIAASIPEPWDLGDDDDPPARGNALLRLLAEESGGQMVELAPGVFYASKAGGLPLA